MTIGPVSVALKMNLLYTSQWGKLGHGTQQCQTVASLTRGLQYGHHLTVSSLSGLVQRSFPILVSQVRVGTMT